MMFKDFLKGGLSKLFTFKNIIIFIVFVVLIWALYTYNGSKWNVSDLMSDGSGSGELEKQPSVLQTSAQNVVPPPVGVAGGASGYSVSAVADPKDLLPSGQNSSWSALNPVSVNPGSGLSQDLLSGVAGRIGLDTVSSSMRNSSLDIRSDPYIPKQSVSPWQNSTIEPDLGKIPLQIN
jgi:hypothetical protein